MRRLPPTDANPADLSADQFGGHAGADAGADLEDAAAHDGQLADRDSRLTRVDRNERPLFVRSLPRLTAPSGSPRLERTTLGSCSIRRRIGAASRLSASPAQVGRTPREVRSSRLTPEFGPARRSAGSARVAPHG